MNDGSASFTARPVAGLGVTETTAAELTRRFRFTRLPATPDPATEVLVVQKGTIDAALLDRMPALKLVATSAAGFDSLDFGLLRSRGIALSNRGNSRDIDVADLTIGLLIAAVRQIGLGDRLIRANRWADARVQQKQRVSGRRLGIYGLGRIGEDICARAKGFDLEIGYHNRRTRDGTPYRYFDTLLALAEWCDFLVVAVPLDDTTRHQVDRRVIDAVGPDGTIVNIARGAVIDEPQLITALAEGRLGSAGLDVFENEPKISEHLFGLDNLVMTPHVGGFTDATQADALKALVANIESFFRTGRPVAGIDLSSI